MLLFRLALLWGVPDPDDLARSLSPEIVDKWVAFDTIEPIGGAWDQCGTIAATIANSATAQLAAQAGRSVQPTDLEEPRQFIPRPPWYRQDYEADAIVKRGLTDDESAQQMRGLI